MAPAPMPQADGSSRGTGIPRSLNAKPGVPSASDTGNVEPFVATSESGSEENSTAPSARMMPDVPPDDPSVVLVAPGGPFFLDLSFPGAVPEPPGACAVVSEPPPRRLSTTSPTAPSRP